MVTYEVDWSSAPEWAEFHAFDLNGDGHWYENQPIKYVTNQRHFTWKAQGGRTSVSGYKTNMRSYILKSLTVRSGNEKYILLYERPDGLYQAFSSTDRIEDAVTIASNSENNDKIKIVRTDKYPTRSKQFVIDVDQKAPAKPEDDVGNEEPISDRMYRINEAFANADRDLGGRLVDCILEIVKVNENPKELIILAKEECIRILKSVDWIDGEIAATMDRDGAVKIHKGQSWHTVNSWWYTNDARFLNRVPTGDYPFWKECIVWNPKYIQSEVEKLTAEINRLKGLDND